ncbi:hypothetical protein GX888_01090 [Candidatus Dojkabacteria bacterium]|uniref:Uncharacterized protein n=1 Tax=Candidatus Dojkabacteria bacterium TaxID=2099670 RepID=A0A847VD11_9BACT|nr:hypothetical protein [Candidatus Dojkabacteria bacterium]
MKNKEKYSGQAIAIIMVVLVVASVIGAALYSRVITSKQISIETTDGKKALEQADSILDIFISSDLQAVQNALRGYLEDDDSPALDELDKIRIFLEENGIDTEILTMSTEWCTNTEPPSPQVMISYADIGDFTEIDVGEVKAVNLYKANIPDSCNVHFAFENIEGNQAPFTVKEVYINESNDEVKPYDLDDMKLYCVSNPGSDCSSEVAPSTSIERTILSNSTDNLLEYNDLKNIRKDSYGIYEIRILPLQRKIGVSIQPKGSDECVNLLSDYKIIAEVQCGQTVKRKQVIIPSERNIGYPTLFDYTIYNNEGVLRPN